MRAAVCLLALTMGLCAVLSGCAGSSPVSGEPATVNYEVPDDANAVYLTDILLSGLRGDTVNNGNDADNYRAVLDNSVISVYLSDKGYEKMYYMSLSPVTSTDGISFYNTGGEKVAANEGTYLEYKAWFICEKDAWVNLDAEGTTVTTGSEALSGVEKAVRVAFDENNMTVIFEPDKGEPVAGQTTKEPQAGSYTEDTSYLFHLTQHAPKLITVRVWVEAEDPDCPLSEEITDLSVTLSLVATGGDYVPYE